ncbi:MAG: hypothetical protein ACJ8ER_02790 [Allosphingosinicella sp.]
MKTGAGQLGLADDVALLEALLELAGNWEKLAAGFDGVHSVETLFDTITADIDSPEVTKAFETAGLADLRTRLKDLLGRIEKLKGKIPPEVRTLLSPVAKFDEPSAGAANPGALDWTLLDPKAEFDNGDGLKLSVAGNAAVSFEAGDTWPFSDPVPDPLLRVGVKAGITAGAGVTLPYSVGTVAVSADASVGAELDYFFDVRSSKDVYAGELARKLPALPDPFAFEAVWDALAATDLQGIVYEFDGSAKVGLDVSLADTASFGDVSAQLGATVGASFTLKTGYTLSFRKGLAAAGGGFEVIAALSRNKVSEQQFDAKVGVEVDLSKLAGRVHEVLQKAIGEWDSMLAEVKPFLSPGTWLQTRGSALIEAQANKLISDSKLAEAVTRDLKGAIGIDTSDTSALAGWLAGEIGGALDQASGVISGKADDATASVLDALSRRLPAFAQPELQARIKPVVDKLVADTRAEFEKRVQALLEQPGKALAKALKGAGAAVGDKVTKLDEALAPLRKLVDRYDKLFHEILDESGKAVRRKLSASLSVGEARTDKTTYQVLGRLQARSSRAGDVFRALTRGRLDRIKSLVDRDDPFDDFVLDPKSSITRYSKSTSTLGFEAVLFGFGLSGTELLSGEATVRADTEGNIYVDTKGKLDKKFKGLSEGTEFSFVDVFTLVRARAVAAAGAPANRTMELGVTITQTDNSLKRGEVEGFVTSLEQAQLLPVGAAARAAEKFGSWVGQGTGKSLVADLSAKLWLPGAAAVRMMQLEHVVAGTLDRAARERIIRTAVKILGEVQKDDWRVEEGAKVAWLQFGDGSGSFRLDDFFIAFRPPVEEPMFAKLSDQERYRDFVQEHGRLQDLVSLVEEMARVYLATPRGLGSTDPSEWGADQYRAAQKRLAGYSRKWLTINNDFIFWVKSEVHPRTIALLRIMAALAEVDSRNAVAVVMIRKSDSKDETFVLSGPGALPF